MVNTASGVAEFAMWAAPALGARYLDLQYTDRFRSQPLPPWTRRVPPVDGGAGGRLLRRARRRLRARVRRVPPPRVAAAAGRPAVRPPAAVLEVRRAALVTRAFFCAVVA